MTSFGDLVKYFLCFKTDAFWTLNMEVIYSNWLCVCRQYTPPVWSSGRDVRHSVQFASSRGVHQRVQQRARHASVDSIHTAATGTHTLLHWIHIRYLETFYNLQHVVSLKNCISNILLCVNIHRIHFYTTWRRTFHDFRSATCDTKMHKNHQHETFKLS